MLDYDEAALLARVDKLDRKSRIGFAAACAERLWPLLAVYQDAAGRPQEEFSALRAVLDSVWAVAAGAEPAGHLDEDEALVESLVPSDDDEDWVFESAYGQNGLAALAYAARTVLTDDSQEAVWAAQQLYEATDVAAQQVVATSGLTRAESERALLEHPAVQWALRSIDGDLSRSAFTVAAELRSRAASEAPELLALIS